MDADRYDPSRVRKFARDSAARGTVSTRTPDGDFQACCHLGRRVYFRCVPSQGHPQGQDLCEWERICYTILQ